MASKSTSERKPKKAAFFRCNALTKLGLLLHNASRMNTLILLVSILTSFKPS